LVVVTVGFELVVVLVGLELVVDLLVDPPNIGERLTVDGLELDPPNMPPEGLLVVDGEEDRVFELEPPNIPPEDRLELDFDPPNIPPEDRLEELRLPPNDRLEELRLEELLLRFCAHVVSASRTNPRHTRIPSHCIRRMKNAPFRGSSLSVYFNSRKHSRRHASLSITNRLYAEPNHLET
jgi:hypothetical protein